MRVIFCWDDFPAVKCYISNCKCIEYLKHCITLLQLFSYFIEKNFIELSFKMFFKNTQFQGKVKWFYRPKMIYLRPIKLPNKRVSVFGSSGCGFGCLACGLKTSSSFYRSSSLGAGLKDSPRHFCRVSFWSLTTSHFKPHFLPFPLSFPWPLFGYFSLFSV